MILTLDIKHTFISGETGARPLYKGFSSKLKYIYMSDNKTIEAS